MKNFQKYLKLSLIVLSLGALDHVHAAAPTAATLTAPLNALLTAGHLSNIETKRKAAPSAVSAKAYQDEVTKAFSTSYQDAVAQALKNANSYVTKAGTNADEKTKAENIVKEITFYSARAQAYLDHAAAVVAVEAAKAAPTDATKKSAAGTAVAKAKTSITAFKAASDDVPSTVVLINATHKAVAGEMLNYITPLVTTYPAVAAAAVVTTPPPSTNECGTQPGDEVTFDGKGNKTSCRKGG